MPIRKKIPLDTGLLRNLVDSLGVSINIFNKEGRRIFVNPHFYHLSGLSPESGFNPDMSEGVNEEKSAYLTKKLMKAIRTGRTFEIRNFYHHSYSTTTRRYFDFTFGPLKDRKGKIIGAYSMVEDVTTRFLAKRKLLTLNNTLEKKVIERTEKLEKISEEKDMMVSDIAHDIKTILTIIKGNLELMDIKKKATEPFEVECHKEIEAEINKMNGISSDLVFIAKSQQYADMFRLEKFDIANLIGEMVKKYRPISIDKIRIINNSRSRNPLCINADKSKISTLISNLIENAIKFRKDKDAKLEIAV